MVSSKLHPAIAENYALVYGTELHYLEAGEGPLVILLHGLVETAYQWHLVMEELSTHFYVIALDQIGFGYSTKPLLNYRIKTLVDFLDGFCQVLGIREVSLVGAGIGGWVAAAFTLQYSDQVNHLAFVNAHLSSTMLEQSSLIALQPPSVREHAQQLLQSLFYNNCNFVTEHAIDQRFTQQMLINDGYTKQQLIQSIGRDEDKLGDRLSDLTIPTLFIHGQNDQFTSPAWSERLSHQLPHSQLTLIDRCGHLPHVEQPEALSAALLQFLLS
ncbi:alpha/beta fold hydrolase [Leptolyngbya sp. FACHB-261]|uniref:alpha/beta fold hydrolase n=1 Tax=Leptolyngbya sp. FACHB-261 TaxID=2692806 RepID=UPI00168549A1|nr:alpha/beta hydrolase [Leptolyngbya sp. FACHB-261]MBD2100995.1 alpha/beta hydrolase [Leptolyngbya sp. FACHB-261]